MNRYMTPGLAPTTFSPWIMRSTIWLGSSRVRRASWNVDFRWARDRRAAALLDVSESTALRDWRAPCLSPPSCDALTMMEAERWTRLQALFHQALDLGEPERGVHHFGIPPTIHRSLPT
jgi:hypothetical protein